MHRKLPPVAAQFADHGPLTIIAMGVVVLFTIVVILSLIVVAHHLITERRRRGNRLRFEGVSIALAPHIVANQPGLRDAVAKAQEEYGDRAVALVLRRIRYDLRGPVVDRVSGFLTTMGEVKDLLAETKARRHWKRVAAIRGLGECGGAEARNALIEASADESGEVRRGAREGLLTDGSPAAIRAAIHSFLLDLPRRAGWRRSFFSRLAVVGADALTELIRSRSLAAPEEKLALEALGDARRPSALALAIERVQLPDAEMRATAFRVLGKVGTQTELPLMLAGLDDKEWFARAAAARGIEWMLTLNRTSIHASSLQTACEKLGTRLGDGSWWVRANAARALARAGDAGVNVLLRATDEVDRYARDAAIAALSMATLTEEVRVTLKKKLDKNNEQSAAAKLTPSTGKPADLFA